MDNSTPNHEENYQVNQRGKLEKWVGQIISVEMKDENGKFNRNLDVEDCRTYKEIRKKEMKVYWAYFEERGFTSEKIIEIIREKMKYHPKEFNEFLKNTI